MQDTPDSQVVTWLDEQPKTSLWTTSVTLFEIQSGLQIMPAGKCQRRLSEVFQLILQRMDHRVAAFDDEAAIAASSLAASRRKIGKVVEVRDTMIAGIVLSHHASLATRNTSHFADIFATVVNPWSA